MQAELAADRDAGERLSRSRVDDIAALSINSDRFLAAIDHASAESGELCTLAQAIEAATDQNQPLARKKRLQFEFSDTGSAILPMLPPRTLGEITSGLIEFAMQDAKLGSVITLEVLREWPTMHLKITNDGIGIPSQRLEEIQNPNGRNITELSRYRAAVSRFSGRLDVTSSVGKTTIIDLYLPSIPAIVRAS